MASVINVGYGTTQIAAEGASDVYNGQNFSRTGYIDTLNSRAGCNIFFPPLAGGKIPPNSTVISLYSNVDFPYNFSDLCPNTCAPIYVIFGGVNNTTGTFLNGTGTRFIAIHLDNCTATTCCGTTVKRCLNSVSFTNTGSTK
ncbi:MAG: hypothetical protein IPJ43_21495 [Saprospiraceae bacterium]|nr:hypothetical protein [Saprospiraceae bacterium]